MKHSLLLSLLTATVLSSSAAFAAPNSITHSATGLNDVVSLSAAAGSTDNAIRIIQNGTSNLAQESDNGNGNGAMPNTAFTTYQSGAFNTSYVLKNGDGNLSKIYQIGSENSASLTQSGADQATIVQSGGSNNTAKVTENGMGTSALVNQSGSLHSLIATLGSGGTFSGTQSGYNLAANVMSNGAGNTIGTYQDGAYSHINSNLTGSGLGVSINQNNGAINTVTQNIVTQNSTARVLQSGDSNTSSQSISGNGVGNRVYVAQVGNGNFAKEIITGSNNTELNPVAKPGYTIYQKGNDNSATNTKSGIGNSSIVYQSGNSDTANLTQTGAGLIANLHQIGGDNNLMNIYEYGTMNKATITQTGSLNNYYALLSGANNTLTGTQTGTGNQAAVIETGSGNTITTTQKGAGNGLVINGTANGSNLTIYQNGAGNTAAEQIDGANATTSITQTSTNGFATISISKNAPNQTAIINQHSPNMVMNLKY